MHLLRTQPLINALAKGGLTPQDQATYAIANVVLWTFAYYSGLVVAGAPVWTIPSLLEAFAIIGITVVGVVRCFDAAGGNSNRSFLIEFSCLSVPITLPIVIVVWGGYWTVTLAFRDGLIALSRSNMQFAINLGNLGADLFGLLSFIAVVAVQSSIYYRLAKALQQVQRAKDDA